MESETATIYHYKSLKRLSKMSKKIRVGLVQINSEFSGQVYLPLVTGYLASYFLEYSKYSNEVIFDLPIYKRDKVKNIVNKLKNCDVIGFSIYVWNEQLSLAVASSLKQINPKVLVIFGGPQVPDFAEDYLKKNKFIDVCVHNEGEQSFTELLENYIRGESLSIPNTSMYISKNNQSNYVKIPNRPKIKDLDLIPSPFLNGYFDQLMAAYPDQTFLGLWESNRGCPFSCTFCDWGSSTASKVNQFGTQRLFSEIEWIGSRKIPFVFVCDANFGLLPRDEELANHVAKVKSEFGFPEAFSVQNTKNVKERAFKVQKILSDAGLNKGVTLSMQSLHPETLKLIKRDNISLDSYRDLQDRFMNAGVSTYSDLILGLPGETYDSWINGINMLINNGQHNRIQFNNLSLLPNAEMSSTVQRNSIDFITVKSQIVNVHGSKSDLLEDVPELQELVVGTNTMPKEDWVKSRIFAWWVALLYFDKLFQIPLSLLKNTVEFAPALMVKKIIEEIETSNKYRVLSMVHFEFKAKAKLIQNGDVEYMWNERYLDVFWPADEYALIKLVENKDINNFYEELEEISENILSTKIKSNVLENFIRGIKLNKKLLKLPIENSQNSKAVILSDTDKMLLRRYILMLNPHLNEKNIQISSQISTESLDFSTWQRKVVWYGHRSGAYLKTFHTIINLEDLDILAKIPGHF